VFVPDLEFGHPGQIDIFSLNGKYLYKVNLKFGNYLKHLFSPYHNLVIQDDCLYVVLENENDDVLIVKYHVTLPFAE
jgi:hypothetical protein